MGLKPAVVKDILCVVAYGTAPARASAAKLLFYYWPSFNPNLFDRRAVLMKFASAFRNFPELSRISTPETFYYSILMHLQTTWLRLSAKGTPAQTQGTQKLAKCATIIEFLSHSPPKHRRQYICASNAQTRYTGRIRIRCSTIFCTPCNRCLWYAKTRWAFATFKEIFQSR